MEREYPYLGDLRSPWWLTTYKSWDDPPSSSGVEMKPWQANTSTPPTWPWPRASFSPRPWDCRKLRGEAPGVASTRPSWEDFSCDKNRDGHNSTHIRHLVLEAPGGWNMMIYGGFLKWWYPQKTPKWSFLVGKPMVVGYQHFRKHPYDGC